MTLRNKMSCCIFRKKLLPVLCFLCFTIPVFAQNEVSFVGDDRIGIDVSFQLGGAATQSELQSGTFGLGGRVGYHLGSIVFLDAGILFEPNGWQKHNSPDRRDDRAVILGGVRFGTIFDDKIGVFAKARAGAFWFSDKYLVPPDSPYPVIDVGIIIEQYFVPNRDRDADGKQFFVRWDIGSWIVPYGDTKEAAFGNIGTKRYFAFEVGLGVRF